MDDLIKNIPEILEKTGSLFAVVSLVSILVFIMACFLYFRSSQRDRNRAFVLSLLFFVGMIFFLTITGVVSGYQKGDESVKERVAIDPSDVDPTLVSLSEKSINDIEKYLENKNITDSNKNRRIVVEKALDILVNTPEKSPDSEEPSESPPTEAPDSQITSQEVKLIDKNDFISGQFQAASRDEEGRPRLGFSVTNISDQTIYISTESKTTSIYDNKGANCYGSISGIKDNSSRKSASKNIQNYNAINPQSTLNISFSGHSNAACEISDGDKLFFSQGFIRYKEDGNENFTIGFKNAPIQGK